eukprot:1501339-Pyramimonas_sp.AAC.1
MLGVWVRWTHRTVFGAVVPHLILVGCRRSGWRCCFRVLLAALGLNEAPTAFRVGVRVGARVLALEDVGAPAPVGEAPKLLAFASRLGHVLDCDVAREPKVVH